MMGKMMRMTVMMMTVAKKNGDNMILRIIFYFFISTKGPITRLSIVLPGLRSIRP